MGTKVSDITELNSVDTLTFLGRRHLEEEDITLIKDAVAQALKEHGTILGQRSVSPPPELDWKSPQFVNVRYLWWKKYYRKLLEAEKNGGLDLGDEIMGLESDDEDEGATLPKPIPLGMKLKAEGKEKGRTRLARGENVTLHYVVKLNGRPIDADAVEAAQTFVKERVEKWEHQSIAAATFGELDEDLKFVLFKELIGLVPEFAFGARNWKLQMFLKDQYAVVMAGIRARNGGPVKKQHTEEPKV
jgi:hypothetical protein